MGLNFNDYRATKPDLTLFYFISYLLTCEADPLVGIGLTKLPNSGLSKAYPAHPLVASLVSIQERFVIKSRL